MARSLSNFRMFSAYFANGIAGAIIPRRGYSAAVEEATAVSIAEGRIDGEVKLMSGKDEVTWMPDPKTGFFGPGNRREEVDAVELRAMMLRRRRDSNLVAPQ